MKLKSILPMFAALTGLMMPTLSHADTTAPKPAASTTASTYGAVSNNAFLGSIAVTNTNGKITQTYYDLRSADILNNWSIFYYSVTSLSNSVDAKLNYHSVVKAIIFFTGGQYNKEPGNAEVDITVPASGPQTIGVKINDYYHPATVLYTSGTGANGSILQLPITAGAFDISP